VIVTLIRRVLIFAAVSLLSVVAASASAGGDARATHPSSNWRARLAEEVPLLGHRNWIAVVDSAYPLQTSAGIETVNTDADQLEVVQTVLGQLAKARHVRPVIFTDAELKAVPESDAAGVTAYREALSKLLGKMEGGKPEAQSLPHEEIISKLDEAGKTFHILVLKSRMTIPYTSVFLRLECGYWTAEEERRLRERMGTK
jgi:D-ribose pyranose/furanose isomerase RbsD